MSNLPLRKRFSETAIHFRPVYAHATIHGIFSRSLNWIPTTKLYQRFAGTQFELACLHLKDRLSLMDYDELDVRILQRIVTTSFLTTQVSIFLDLRSV